AACPRRPRRRGWRGSGGASAAWRAPHGSDIAPTLQEGGQGGKTLSNSGRHRPPQRVRSHYGEEVLVRPAAVGLPSRVSKSARDVLIRSSFSETSSGGMSFEITTDWPVSSLTSMWGSLRLQKKVSKPVRKLATPA